MIVGWMTCGVRAPEMMVDICERERELLLSKNERTQNA